MTPKKQKIKNKQSKPQNRIEKFLVKTSAENEADNTGQDEELKQKIKDLQDKISELLEEKRKLECLKLPKPYKLKDIPLNYDNIKFTDSSFGTHLANFRLKFHEFTGCVVSKFDENMLVVKFNVYASNKVHVYGIRLNTQDGICTYSKCFVPPIIKIKELLNQYSISSNPKPFIRVLATSCEVFHDIQIQIDQFKEKLDSKDVTIFNSFNNRVIILGFKMVQRSTESVFPVSVEFLYDIYKPRPISIIINSKEMPASTLKAFRKQCKNFSRFSLWNAFEIITNMGLKQHDSVFYLLQEQHDSAENIVGKPIIKKKKKSKVIKQILRDFTFDSNEEDISVQKDESNSSLDKSNAEISSQIAKSLRPQLKNQLEIKESEESEKSSLENIVQNTSKQSKVERSEASEISLRTKNEKPEKSLAKTSNKNSKELKNGVKRSFEQSFTNAETSDKIKLTKTQTENIFSKIINFDESDSNTVFSKATVIVPEKSLAVKLEKVQLKNNSSQKSPKIAIFQENENLNSQNSPSKSHNLLNANKKENDKKNNKNQIGKAKGKKKTKELQKRNYQRNLRKL